MLEGIGSGRSRASGRHSSTQGREVDLNHRSLAYEASEDSELLHPAMPADSHPVDGPVGNRSRPLITHAERGLLCAPPGPVTV